MRDRIAIPPMAERPSTGDSVVSDWQEYLEEEGLKVVSFKTLSADEAGAAMYDARAVLVPSSSPYGDGKATATMAFGTINALEAANTLSVPVFSERPLADGFKPLQDELSEHPYVRRFRQLVYEFGETVVGQDVSIIQEKLGVR